MRGRAWFVIALALAASPPTLAQGDATPAAAAVPPPAPAAPVPDAEPPPAPAPAVPVPAAELPRHPTVAAVVDPCVPVDTGEFHRVLSLELGRDVQYLAGDASATGVTRIHVGCVADGVELRLEDPVTRKSMARVLSLEALADRPRTRLLALAAAEFVVASWIELSLRTAPSVEPVAPPPSEAAQRAVAEIVREKHPPPPPPSPPPQVPAPDAGWQVAAAATAQLWSSHDALVLGGVLRLLRHSRGHLAWMLALDGGVGRPDTPEGKIALTSFGASGALLLHVRGRGGALFAGPGARGGVVRLAGDPDAASIAGKSFFAPMVGPIGYGRAEVVLWDPLRAALDLEVGLATMPTRAQSGDETIFELDGAWFTGALGLGAVF